MKTILAALSLSVLALAVKVEITARQRDLERFKKETAILMLERSNARQMYVQKQLATFTLLVYNSFNRKPKK